MSLKWHPELSGTSKVTTMDVNEETFRIIYFSSLPFLDELTTDFDCTFGRPPRGTDEKVLLECHAEQSSRSKVTILFVNENIFLELLHFPYLFLICAYFLIVSRLL